MLDRIAGKKIICIADDFSEPALQPASGRDKAQTTIAYGTQSVAKAYINRICTWYKYKSNDASLGIAENDTIKGKKIILSHENYPFVEVCGLRKQGKFKGNPAYAVVNKIFYG